ncbi:MAG TPA: TlpA disulfide reductase family protein [bacterium]|nr:MAG: Sporulation thiol-disulfide oxidoreductase A precursor [bacterium ADurb.Bin236]HPI77100.1 TlpA disulfide reductase family protein [bacterium]HPN95067.1 TlpA disulfide reductase family protein [bacterium]
MIRPKRIVEKKVCLAKMLAASAALLIMAGSAREAVSAPDRERGVAIGTAAPRFSLPDRYGNIVSLDDYIGRKVILYFWVSWCICRDQLPLLQEFRGANPGVEFEIVSVSVDAQGARYVNPIADMAKITYPALLDTRAETARLYHYPATPATFLINEAGVVVGQYLMDFELKNEKTRKELEEFIAMPAVESPGPAAPKPSASELAGLVEKNPGNPVLRRRLAGLLQTSGDASASIAHWEALVEMDKKNCEDKFSLGSAYYSSGDTAKAIKYWKAAAKCDQTNYIYMRTAQSFENPDNFYSEDKMKDLYSDELK